MKVEQVYQCLGPVFSAEADPSTEKGMIVTFRNGVLEPVDPVETITVGIVLDIMSNGLAVVLSNRQLVRISSLEGATVGDYLSTVGGHLQVADRRYDWNVAQVVQIDGDMMTIRIL